MRRISALTALVFLLTCWALPADATSRRPRLAKVTVQSVVQPTEPGRELACDAANFFDCGYVAVAATFTGLSALPEPAPGDGQLFVHAGGTASISRSYGCRIPDGPRLREYDRTVRQNVSLNTRRGFPVPVPEEGDELSLQVWSFLLDGQPGNCPAGTEAIMYRFTTTRVRLNLETPGASAPFATYRIFRRSTWHGEVLTPAVAG